MKKILLFLLVILGVAVNSANYQKSSSSYEKNFNARISWKTVFLSKDRSTMSLIRVQEEKEMRKSKDFSILYSVSRYDTLKTYVIQKEARRFMTDSIAYILLNWDIVDLTDSTIPRWTHVFGKDIAIKRSLEISNNQVSLISRSEPIDPINRNLLITFLIISFIVLLLNLASLFDSISSSWFVLGIGIFLLITTIYFEITKMPLFDIIFISSSFVLVTIIFLIVRIRRKIIEKKNKVRFIILP